MTSKKTKATGADATAAKKKLRLEQHSKKRHGFASPLRRSAGAAVAAYERLKRAWQEQHPDAGTAEYDAAIRAIARRCGV